MTKKEYSCPIITSTKTKRGFCCTLLFKHLDLHYSTVFKNSIPALHVSLFVSRSPYIHKAVSKFSQRIPLSLNKSWITPAHYSPYFFSTWTGARYDCATLLLVYYQLLGVATTVLRVLLFSTRYEIELEMDGQVVRS